MSETRLREIRARLEAATRGPWRVRKEPARINEVGKALGLDNGEPLAWDAQVETTWDHPQLRAPALVVGTAVSPYLEPPTRIWASDDDLDLIAHAPADLAYLLDTAARLTRELEEARKRERGVRSAVIRAGAALVRLDLRWDPREEAEWVRRRPVVAIATRLKDEVLALATPQEAPHAD